ncbi:MAG: hypothetical protein JWN74_2750 [Acidobacteriaceae bacterium]|nr:hypothetical protein [Acidobacteriaceae bacterium]
MRMRFDNAAVHARSQAEVVRVDNQPPHDASLAGKRGLTRVSSQPYTASSPQPGRLAQLVRAPALQAGGRRFESCTAHQFPQRLCMFGAYGLSQMAYRSYDYLTFQKEREELRLRNRLLALRRAREHSSLALVLFSCELRSVRSV